MVTVHCTSELSQKEGKKVLVYGPAGVGKTPLVTTCENPIIMGGEVEGLTSISDTKTPYIEVRSWNDFIDGCRYVHGSKDKYKTIFVDSLSQIFEYKIQEELKKHKDGRQAYGVLGDCARTFLNEVMNDKMKGFDFVCLAKLGKEQDEEGKNNFYPLFTGSVVTSLVRHAFSNVWAFREVGNKKVLQIHGDIQWFARSREPNLVGEDAHQETDISKLFKKMRGVK